MSTISQTNMNVTIRGIILNKGNTIVDKQEVRLCAIETTFLQIAFRLLRNKNMLSWHYVCWIDENGGLNYLPTLTSNELSMIMFFHCFKCTLFVLLIALPVVKEDGVISLWLLRNPTSGAETRDYLLTYRNYKTPCCSEEGIELIAERFINMQKSVFASRGRHDSER
jgi:hypothetical protein